MYILRSKKEGVGGREGGQRSRNTDDLRTERDVLGGGVTNRYIDADVILGSSVFLLFGVPTVFLPPKNFRAFGAK